MKKGQDISDSIQGPIIWVDDTLTALQQLAKAYLKHVNPKVIGGPALMVKPQQKI